MGDIPGLVGGTNWLRSGLANTERSINCRPEKASPGTPKTEAWLGNTPGLQHVITIGPDPVETLFVILDRVLGVAGTDFFELHQDGTITKWGTVAHDGANLATMCSGGTASDTVLIVAGSMGYVFKLSDNSFVQITDPDFPANAAMCDFFAGFFLVLVRESRTFHWSTLEDPLTWDPIDNASVTWAGDPVVFLKRCGTHIWLVGQYTAQVWYATGDVLRFAPASETLIEHGSIAPHSGQRIGENAMIWLDRNEAGGGLIVVASGITPNNITTFSIAWMQEQIAVGPGKLDKSVGIPIQVAGHLDYILLNRDAEAINFTTPVFDFAEGTWHERATWNAATSLWEQSRVGCHAYCWQKHWVGDYRTGAIYEMSTGFYNEELVEV